MSDFMLTVSQVAAVFQVPPRSVYRMIEQGYLDAVRLTPRKIRVRASQVEALTGIRPPRPRLGSRAAARQYLTNHQESA
jgi:excisionase family DNA binding protein